MACVVDPGVHEVDLEFKPRDLVIGASITAASLLLTLALYLAAWFCHRVSRISASRIPPNTGKSTSKIGSEMKNDNDFG